MDNSLLLIGFVLSGLLVVVWRFFASQAAPDNSQDSPLPDEHSVIDSPEDRDELLVVLAAAATAALGQHVVVRRVTFLNQNTVSGWAEAGRTSLHWSHNVPRNN